MGPAMVNARADTLAGPLQRPRTAANYPDNQLP